MAEMFVDRVQVDFQAGKGGDGCVSFRREKYVPKGGPNGGDGGDGGSIILRAMEGVNSLVSFAHQKMWRADSGGPGLGSNCHGRNGKDVVLDVPPGTVIIDHSSGLILKDLVKVGDTVIVARGGKGGKGNTHFKSSTNRAPRESTPGTLGEQRRVILELKVIADVGLVGMPNAGKSTLLSRLSRARPQIADYPFTTKTPNLGLVSLDQDRNFVLADIPGLIEGAAEGVGLGHDFLRHVMRAGILIHLVEPFPADQSDPVSNYMAIRAELEAYDEQLRDRPEVIAITKAELPGAEAIRDQLAEKLGEVKAVLLISAVTGAGLNQLMGRVAELLAERPSCESDA
jgi:GTP-binding protein